jgi:hypothetical protein
MEHASERGGVEGSIDWKRLADIGFDSRDVEVLQALRGMIQDMRIRVEERDWAVLRKAGPFQEVACARANIQVTVADVPPVWLHQSDGRAAPHDSGEEAEDDGVVDLEELR